MKKFLSSLFFFILSFNAVGQESIRIKYNLEYSIDTANLKNKNSEIMLLDIIPNENTSYFRSEATYKKDSILQSPNEMTLLGAKKPKFRYTINKNLGSQKLTVYEDYTIYKFSLEDVVELKWNIKNDVAKEILGNKCQLATTSFRGRDYEAWFSEELPFSDGPYKFSGLPGVILELYDSQKHYHFQARQIMKITDYKPYLDILAYKQVSKEEFQKFADNVKERPSMILENPGIKWPAGAMEKYDKTHRERNKYKNNPLELEK